MFQIFSQVMFWIHYTQTYLVVFLKPYTTITLIEGQIHFHSECLFVGLANKHILQLRQSLLRIKE